MNIASDISVQPKTSIPASPSVASSGDLTLSSVLPSLLAIPPSDYPVLSGVPITIHLVFVGVPSSLVDLPLIRSKLPTWYSPIDRAQRVSVPVTTRYVNYSITYDFSIALSTVANEYASWILQSQRISTSPYWIQEEPNLAPTAGYVDSSAAEDWFRGHFSSLVSSGYTLFIVDTFDTTPSVTDYYFYDSGYVAGDSHVDAGRRYSRFGIGFGGDYRFLFLDLSAGPTRARDLDADSIPPIWTYDIYADKDRFSSSVALYLHVTIGSRFLASWLYEPRYSPNYYLELMVFSNDSSFDYASYVQTTTILDAFKALQPRSSWHIDVSSHYLWNYPELYSVLQSSYNASYGYIQYFPGVHDYLLAHYLQYVQPHTDGQVIPVLIFAFPAPVGFEFLGMADGDSYGNPTFVAIGVDRVILGIDPIVYPTSTFTLYPGYLATDSYLYGLLGYGGKDVLSGTLTVNYGEADFYILDEANFNLWQAGKASHGYQVNTALAPGTYPFSFAASAPGYYYLVLYNRYTDSTSATFAISESLTLGYSLAWVVTHESGHMLGLPHPHDFYLPPYDETWSFLWDYSASAMGYFIEKPSFGQLDRDILFRGDFLTSLHDTARALSDLRDRMINKQVRYVPLNVLSTIKAAEDSLNGASNLFNDTSTLDNYERALNRILNASSIVRSAATILNHDMQLPPSLTALGSVPEGANVRSGAIFLNGTLDDIYGFEAKATLDGNPIPFLQSDASHFVLVAANPGEGRHSFMLRIPDAAGNVLTQELGFTVDLTPPVLKILSPSQGSTIGQPSVVVSWSVTDALSGFNRSELRVDAGELEDTGGQTSITLANMEEGHHVVVIRAFDRAGNWVDGIIAFSVKTSQTSGQSGASSQYGFLSTVPRSVLYATNAILLTALIVTLLAYRRRTRSRAP